MQCYSACPLYPSALSYTDLLTRDTPVSGQGKTCMLCVVHRSPSTVVRLVDMCVIASHS